MTSMSNDDVRRKVGHVTPNRIMPRFEFVHKTFDTAEDPNCLVKHLALLDSDVVANMFAAVHMIKNSNSTTMVWHNDGKRVEGFSPALDGPVGRDLSRWALSMLEAWNEDWRYYRSIEYISSWLTYARAYRARVVESTAVDKYSDWVSSFRDTADYQGLCVLAKLFSGYFYNPSEDPLIILGRNKAAIGQFGVAMHMPPHVIGKLQWLVEFFSFEAGEPKMPKMALTSEHAQVRLANHARGLEWFHFFSTPVAFGDKRLIAQDMDPQDAFRFVYNRFNRLNFFVTPPWMGLLEEDAKHRNRVIELQQAFISYFQDEADKVDHANSKIAVTQEG